MPRACLHRCLIMSWPWPLRGTDHQRHRRVGEVQTVGRSTGLRPVTFQGGRSAMRAVGLVGLDLRVGAQPLRDRHEGRAASASSASIERFFSILKNATIRRQFSECADTLKLRAYCSTTTARKTAKKTKFRRGPCPKPCPKLASPTPPCPKPCPNACPKTCPKPVS